MKIILYFTVFFLCISCSKKQKSAHLISLKKGEVNKLKDSKPFLGELNNTSFNNSHDFFTYDNRENIKEFKDFHFWKVWGKLGKGPCEHGAISNFVAYDDSLYLLDRQQGKYMIYGKANVSSKSCKEIFDERVNRLSGIQVFNNSPYFIRGSLVKSLNDSTPVIYKLNNKKNKIVSTDVTIGDLGIKRIGIPIRLSMASDKKNNNLIFYLPLTKKIFIYNTQKNELKNFHIDLYLAEDENIYESKSLNKIGKLLNNKVEIVFDLFALNNRIAIGYRKGTGENQIWGLEVYNYMGKKLAEEHFNNRVLYMNGNSLMRLKLNVDNQQNPYSLIKYQYQLIKNDKGI